MKMLLLLVVSIFSIGKGSAQVAVAPDIKRFSAPELSQTISTNALLAYGPVAMRKIIAQAIQLERIDLMEACFASSYTQGDLYEAVVTLEDGVLRQKAAIMMLRAPRAICFPGDDPRPMRTARPATGLYEPFITTVAKLLPGETLTQEMVINSKARFKLADRLYAAMQAKGVQFTEAEKNVLQGGSPPADATPTAVPPAKTSPPLIEPVPAVPAVMPAPLPSKSATQLAPPAGESNAGTSSVTLWMPLIAAVAVGWWLMARKKA